MAAAPSAPPLHSLLLPSLHLVVATAAVALPTMWRSQLSHRSRLAISDVARSTPVPSADAREAERLRSLVIHHHVGPVVEPADAHRVGLLAGSCKEDGSRTTVVKWQSQEFHDGGANVCGVREKRAENIWLAAEGVYLPVNGSK